MWCGDFRKFVLYNWVQKTWKKKFNQIGIVGMIQRNYAIVSTSISSLGCNELEHEFGESVSFSLFVFSHSVAIHFLLAALLTNTMSSFHLFASCRTQTSNLQCRSHTKTGARHLTLLPFSTLDKHDKHDSSRQRIDFWTKWGTYTIWNVLNVLSAKTDNRQNNEIDLSFNNCRLNRKILYSVDIIYSLHKSWIRLVFDDPHRINDCSVLVVGNLFKIQMRSVISLHAGVAIVLKSLNIE